ncbi:MAG TPA: hypothetical protein VJ304_05405 [Flavobacterium sp.]|nr:hypothetical protein [Flavobacterium sp.]
MRILNLIKITIYFSIFLSYGQTSKKNDLEKQNIKGNVKSIKTNTFETTDRFKGIFKGEKIERPSNNTYIIYNKKGYETKVNSYHSDGSLINKKSSKKEDIIEIPSSKQSEKGKIYDETGNVIEYNNYMSDGSINYKVLYKYDDNGNEIESISYNSKGRLIEKWSYEYEFDRNKNWIRKILFINGVPTEITEREIEYFK